GAQDPGAIRAGRDRRAALDRAELVPAAARSRGGAPGSRSRFWHRHASHDAARAALSRAGNPRRGNASPLRLRRGVNWGRAGRADGVEVEDQALATARDNAQFNGVELRPTLPEGLRPGAYEIVVSNILAQPLILLAPVFAARTAPGGKLALAGILESQAAEV